MINQFLNNYLTIKCAHNFKSFVQNVTPSSYSYLSCCATSTIFFFVFLNVISLLSLPTEV